MKHIIPPPKELAEWSTLPAPTSLQELHALRLHWLENARNAGLLDSLATLLAHDGIDMNISRHVYRCLSLEFEDFDSNPLDRAALLYSSIQENRYSPDRNRFEYITFLRVVIGDVNQSTREMIKSNSLFVCQYHESTFPNYAPPDTDRFIPGPWVIPFLELLDNRIAQDNAAAQENEREEVNQLTKLLFPIRR